jgi:hypothetical protein
MRNTCKIKIIKYFNPDPGPREELDTKEEPGSKVKIEWPAARGRRTTWIKYPPPG